MSELVEAALARARAALRGTSVGDGTIVARLKDGAEPRAFLVSLAFHAGVVVLPLRGGVTRVGRYQHDGLPPWRILEQGQWTIGCGWATASVGDHFSTNLSARLRGPARDGFDHAQRFGLPPDGPGVVELWHANDPRGANGIDLEEGDVLRGCYASFAFGWLARATRP